MLTRRALVCFTGTKVQLLTLLALFTLLAVALLAALF
jgi:hypothetical protein